MNSLTLIKQDMFGNVRCDFWCDEQGEIYMTRKQIGEALEYKNPNDAIRLLHERHKDRIDKYSVSFKLNGTDGKLYDTILYTAKGIYEICRWSQQPKADAFMDWVWDIVDSLRKGQTRLVSATQSGSENPQWKFNYAMALLEKFGDALSPEAKTVFLANITEELFGRPMLPKPAVRELVTATEIAARMGITVQRFGRLISKAGNIRNNPEYGISVLDKSKYSDKNVVNFQYFSDKVDEIIDILSSMMKDEQK